MCALAPTIHVAPLVKTIASLHHFHPSLRLTVATLALGSRPRQGLAKVRAKSEAQELHFMLQRVWESVRE